MNAEHDADLAEMEGDAATTQLLLDHHTFGRILERVQGGDPEKAAERSHAKRFRKAIAGERFIAEHESQLAGDQLIDTPCAFGRVPKRLQGTNHQTVAEFRLADRFRKARARGLFTAERESQLAGISVELVQVDKQLVEHLLALGRIPKEGEDTDPGKVAETRSAGRLRHEKAMRLFADEQFRGMSDEQLMEDLPALGRIPKRVQGTDSVSRFQTEPVFAC